MVDVVNKSRVAYLRPKTDQAQVLRENFRNLSSGRIPVSVEQNAAVVASDRSRNKKVTELLGNLNDAVSFSSMALKSLEQLTGNEAGSADAPEVVKEFSQDIDKLRGDIGGVLDLLRNRAQHIEVIQENLTSSEARIEDVDAAQRKAVETSNGIQNDGLAAVDAHQGLSFDRVQALLAED